MDPPETGHNTAKTHDVFDRKQGPKVGSSRLWVQYRHNGRKSKPFSDKSGRRALYLGLCKLENELLKEAKNAQK